MKSESPIDFYKRVTQGTQRHKVITLEHSTGSALEDVKMHPVNKRVLASVISRMPDAMFDAVEEADGNPDDAEETLEEEQGMKMNAVTEDTVAAFEDLCKESLKHDDLAPPQMNAVIDNLGFEALFELGTEIINMSVESDSSVRNFHVQE